MRRNLERNITIQMKKRKNKEEPRNVDSPKNEDNIIVRGLNDNFLCHPLTIATIISLSIVRGWDDNLSCHPLTRGSIISLSGGWMITYHATL